MASWKKTGQLQQFKHKLIDGMKQRGYELEFAERIFQQICGFGEYGFPESHSASFAALAYVSAWLKCYYPAAFYCGLLNSLPMGFYSPSQLIQDATRHDIEIRPVDINKSQFQHTLEVCGADNEGKKALALRLGFCQVHCLSKQGAMAVIQQRSRNGFQSITEFMHCGINKRDQEALASANAFASLSGNRYQARWSMMTDLHRLPLFHNGCHQIAEASKTTINAPNDLQTLHEDYASTGLSLDHHPIALLRKYQQAGFFIPANQLFEQRHKACVTVIGLVTGRQSPGTAAGVTFVTLEDDTGNINVVVWQATARAQKQVFLQAKIMKVIGILEKEGDVIHVIAGKLIDLTPLLRNLNSQSRDFH
jgi:error-prone DNA polymerase